jgi:hypothetical protein
LKNVELSGTQDAKLIRSLFSDAKLPATAKAMPQYAPGKVNLDSFSLKGDDHKSGTNIA